MGFGDAAGHIFDEAITMHTYCMEKGALNMACLLLADKLHM